MRLSHSSDRCLSQVVVKFEVSARDIAQLLPQILQLFDFGIMQTSIQPVIASDDRSIDNLSGFIAISAIHPESLSVNEERKENIVAYPD